MQLRNMRQTCARQRQVYRRLSAKQQASVPFSVQVRTFHSQLLILIVNFLQYYQKEINLEHENNCSEEVLPNSRPQLSDQQSSERNPLSNRMQSVANIHKSETCLRIPKLMATAKQGWVGSRAGGFEAETESMTVIGSRDRSRSQWLSF